MAALAVLAIVQNRVLGASAPWFIFTPAIVLLTLFFGTGPGVAATIAAAAFAGYVAASSSHPHLPSSTLWTASAAFCLSTLGLVWLVAALRRALQDSDALRAAREQDHAEAARREAFLTSVLASSTDCIKVLDLDGRLTFMSEGGQRVMEVSDFNAIAGCPWPDFWEGAGNTEARAAIADATRGASRSFVGVADTMAGAKRWWHVAVSPIRGIDGSVERILSVSRDISELRASEDERDRFVRLAENSTDFIGMAGLDGRIWYLNDAGRRMVGLQDADIGHLFAEDFFPPDQADFVATVVRRAVDRQGRWEGELAFRHFRTGEIIPILYAAFPLTDHEGRVIGFGTVTRDFRERKRAEEQLRMMNGELAHRLKNVLAVVQSIAHQTLHRAADPVSASHDLSARLGALGAATDVLTSSSWRAVDLHALSEQALAPHGRLGHRIFLDGPALTLRAEVAVALALALHELATNAVKYGALSKDGGTVTLRWTVEQRPGGADFVLRWKEAGGPVVTPPTRTGFGSILIERSLRSHFGGRATIDYRPDGLRFELEAPYALAIADDARHAAG
ncbi:MAG: histidine kinase [Sphingomonas hengshuiensis]|uniref:histidine kinase n=1 Tax=Sphingomonas hengshuiensis TaxID=1609977 RepID=A0A2W4ZFF2_9SPHN|nr:MAG: histidine kinase [Sphingomonas hengshuiensis]